MLRNLVIELALLIVTFLITIFHAAREDGHLPPVSKVFHGFWFLIYLICSAVGTWISHDWWMIAAALLIRAIFYNPLLNFLRGEKFFYIHGQSVNGSKFDLILEKFGAFYPFFWILSLFAFIFVQFKF